MTSLLTLMPYIASMQCQRKNVTTARALRHFQNHYIFVKKRSRAPSQPLNLCKPPLKPRNTHLDAGSNLCPWSWTQDDDPTRIPRYLAKAECAGCKHYCKPKDYEHQVLKERCDRTTGWKVWQWRKKSLPIAFVYKPYD